MPLEPFDRKKHQPADLGTGGLSTELTVTEVSPDGKFWNIPSVWWDDEGHPLELRRDLAARAAQNYERLSGKKFPRFDTVEAGVKAANKRSRRGGASKRFLAAP